MDSEGQGALARPFVLGRATQGYLRRLWRNRHRPDWKQDRAALVDLGIADPLLGSARRDRLFEALRRRQERGGCGNYVIAFIHHAMSPVRYWEAVGAEVRTAFRRVLRRRKVKPERFGLLVTKIMEQAEALHDEWSPAA